MIIFLIGFFSIFSVNAEICSFDDNRISSNDPRVGRLSGLKSNSGCAATLVGKNCIITSSVCAKLDRVVEFNIPSSEDGVPAIAKAEDTYEVDPSGFSYDNSGIGKFWAVAKLKRNELTGKLPGEVQGYFPVISKKPRKNDKIYILQYANTNPDRYDVISGEVGANPNGYSLNYSQSSANGVLVKAGIFLIPEIIYHNVDVSHGGAGAPLINSSTHEVVGVHTHGGCQSGQGRDRTNAATSIWGNKEFKKAIYQCLNN
ncbi:hypothetical protein BIY24_03960 [Halobacteriovorax marinus]|uniref:trypsin-like serine peptidase n=1 Tax=Halobacteriovorax marinus TaxID=97084 RepID=UPI000BC35A8D|nr:hypothetical protein [Halobacteriovorax marinus]ATH07121.1 hypothetical protein BIY24_03960 [Halobacteriovorax marinus]